LIPSKLGAEKKVNHLYPGKLYDVGSYRLHIFCMGESKPGVPSILFESGIGSSSIGWIPIQRELSKRTQVCAYDRAGYGWSDEWPSLKNQSLQEVAPKSIDHQVEALDRLLTQAKISGPVILVGHSYGGPISLAFETKYPNRVKGLVLLDPHDDGVAREDSAYTNEISNDFKEYEKTKSPEARVKWESQLKKIEGHLAGYKGGKAQPKILDEDLSILVNSLDPMKWHRVLWSEWRAFHSSCAKVKAHPSKTLSKKALTVISSDPTHKRSEGQSYLHMKIAKLSNQGKFYFALGSGHDIPADRPDLTIKAIVDVLEGKHVGRVILPQFKEPTRFFVDAELADYVRDTAQARGNHEKLKDFCRQLSLGFKTHRDFGYFNDPSTGIRGYYVVCE
jgi:pimeloyl-ACP methyl ester carboxylesterase